MTHSARPRGRAPSWLALALLLAAGGALVRARAPPRGAARDRVRVAARARSGARFPGSGRTTRALVRRTAAAARPRARASAARPGRLYDVTDPSVSRDARRVAFAGRRRPTARGGSTSWTWMARPARDHAHRSAPDLSWRARGRALRGADDLDPCWIGPARWCSRARAAPRESEYADAAATNLFTLDVGRRPAARVSPPSATAPRSRPGIRSAGRVVFARWWFNRYRASNGRARHHHRSRARGSRATR